MDYIILYAIWSVAVGIVVAGIRKVMLARSKS